MSIASGLTKWLRADGILSGEGFLRTPVTHPLRKRSQSAPFQLPRRPSTVLYSHGAALKAHDCTLMWQHLK